MVNRNDDNKCYEPMKNDLLGIGIDAFTDYGDMALNYFLDETIIGNIPIIGTFVKAVKIGLSIKNLRFAKNYCTFIQKIRNNEKTQKDLEQHVNILNNNPKQMKRELETLIIYLEQYKSVDKIQYMANIYRAFLSCSIGGIQWNQALIFFEILDRLLPSDIDDLKKMVIYGAEAEKFNDHSGLLRLSALGLVQYFNGKEEKYGHNKTGVAKLTVQGKAFYRVITAAKTI